MAKTCVAICVIFATLADAVRTSRSDVANGVANRWLPSSVAHRYTIAGVPPIHPNPFASRIHPITPIAPNQRGSINLDISVLRAFKDANSFSNNVADTTLGKFEDLRIEDTALQDEHTKQIVPATESERRTKRSNLEDNKEGDFGKEHKLFNDKASEVYDNLNILDYQSVRNTERTRGADEAEEAVPNPNNKEKNDYNFEAAKTDEVVGTKPNMKDKKQRRAKSPPLIDLDSSANAWEDGNYYATKTEFTGSFDLDYMDDTYVPRPTRKRRLKNNFEADEEKDVVGINYNERDTEPSQVNVLGSFDLDRWGKNRRVEIDSLTEVISLLKERHRLVDALDRADGELAALNEQKDNLDKALESTWKIYMSAKRASLESTSSEKVDKKPSKKKAMNWSRWFPLRFLRQTDPPFHTDEDAFWR